MGLAPGLLFPLIMVVFTVFFVPVVEGKKYLAPLSGFLDIREPCVLPTFCFWVHKCRGAFVSRALAVNAVYQISFARVASSLSWLFLIIILATRRYTLRRVGG